MVQLKRILIERQLDDSPRVDSYGMSDAAFYAHSDIIKKNIDAASFAYGDKRLLEEAFDFIISTKRGRKMVEGIPEDVKIQGTQIDSSKNAAGTYQNANRQIDVGETYIRPVQQKDRRPIHLTILGRTIKFQPTEKRIFDMLFAPDSVMDLDMSKKMFNEIERTKPVDFKTTEILFHELKHANQYTSGLTLDGKKANVEQVLTAEKLIEAETRAWDIVNNITHYYINRGQYYAETGPRSERGEFNPHLDTYQTETELIKQNAAVFKNQPVHREIPVDNYTRDWMNFYAPLLQQNLKKYNDLEQAQQKTVGRIMADYMQPSYINRDHFWKNYYDKQAVHALLYRAYKNDLSVQGNDVAFEGVLDHYSQKYGIDKGLIRSAHINEKYDPVIEKINQVTDFTAEYKTIFDAWDIYKIVKDQPDVMPREFMVKNDDELISVSVENEGDKRLEEKAPSFTVENEGNLPSFTIENSEKTPRLSETNQRDDAAPYKENQNDVLSDRFSMQQTKESEALDYEFVKKDEKLNFQGAEPTQMPPQTPQSSHLRDQLKQCEHNRGNDALGLYRSSDDPQNQPVTLIIRPDKRGR